MPVGTLYGIGIGPGDPELVTVRGARLIARLGHVFVPKARTAADSVAMTIARPYLRRDAVVRELVFPMTADGRELSERWKESAGRVAAVLEAGDDACFLTLGDPLLYSTYIYLLRALRAVSPEAKAVTVPGIPAFGAAAALTGFPLGEGKEPVTIVPSTDDLETLARALDAGGTVVIMKIGKRLPEVLRALGEADLLEQGVFVSRAGQSGQRIETDLRNLGCSELETGYLSIILVHAGRRRQQ